MRRPCRYLIASFPKEFKISYARPLSIPKPAVVNDRRLPDSTWRPLIVRNLSNPSVLAVDEQSRRIG